MFVFPRFLFFFGHRVCGCAGGRFFPFSRPVSPVLYAVCGFSFLANVGRSGVFLKTKEVLTV